MVNNTNTHIGLLHFMESFLNDHKRELYHQLIKERTRYLTVVVEDIFQSQNASAVLRTADCFGVQDVHIIENENKYQINPDVAMGATKWLNLHRYRAKEFNTIDCINTLKAKGYRIVATSPQGHDVTPFNMPLDKPIALMFGTELTGLTNTALQMADAKLTIPMYGFTESFNISVSASICMSILVERLRASDSAWRLTEEEMLAIRMMWAQRTLNRPDLIEKEYFERIAPQM
jgi:tRNA (guanosine-2'-O-)-methyltransferase